MIPPVVSGQTQEQQNMVGWKNTFNMRQVTLMNLAASYSGGRNGSVTHFMSGGCITSSAKSLDLLRKNLQNAINKDIDNVIKKYLEKFFQPAINNIKMNLGKNSVTDELLKTVCQQMLEDAKVMYKVAAASASSRDSSPYTYSDSEICSAVDTRLGQMSPVQYKRKESDTDSDTSCITNPKHHKTHAKIPTDVLYKLPEKREDQKWDPERINSNTLFIMGARANKVLGYGQTRGRLYVRHPNVLRYPSDSEDKEWLSANNLMPPGGGKSYLMLVEDVQELAMSDDYRNNPTLQLQELCGFEAPLFMISKIKAYLESLRTDKNLLISSDMYEYQQGQNLSTLDSEPSTPSEGYTIVEPSHSFTGVSTIQPDIISIPGTSPTSSNSFNPGHYTQNVLCSSNSVPEDTLTMDLSHVESSSHLDPSLSLIEKFKQRKVLDHLISTHGTGSAT